MRTDPGRCIAFPECIDFCPMDCIVEKDGGGAIAIEIAWKRNRMEKAVEGFNRTPPLGSRR